MDRVTGSRKVKVDKDKRTQTRTRMCTRTGSLTSTLTQPWTQKLVTDLWIFLDKTLFQRFWCPSSRISDWVATSALCSIQQYFFYLYSKTGGTVPSILKVYDPGILEHGHRRLKYRHQRTATNLSFLQQITNRYRYRTIQTKASSNPRKIVLDTVKFSN
jgi:hypothetical protein